MNGRRWLQQGFDVALFDALYQEQLLAIGELIDEQANAGQLFSVGSSGIEMALGQYWEQHQCAATGNRMETSRQSSSRLPVIAGSCSAYSRRSN